MISVSEADDILAMHGVLLPACDCPLASAQGRILREVIRADRQQPPYDRVTMDGIALSSAAVAAGVRSFRLQGVQAAGQRALRLEGSDACIEVMTGAVLPVGCDAVIRSEDVEAEGNSATLRGRATVRRLQNVHTRGSDALAGAEVVSEGVRLSPAHIGIAAAMGAASLAVSALPAVAVISTGDELVDVGAEVGEHQVRRSNGYAIAAALRAQGLGEAAYCHIADDREQLSTGLSGLLDSSDLLIVTGGVSMGRFDFVPAVLAELGVEAHFHRVSQRPGRPMWFGTRAGKVVFGLPGNPVSALTCLYRYVLPFLHRSSGATTLPQRLVRLSAEAVGLSGLTRFLHVSLDRGAGPYSASPVETNTSGDFLSLGQSDGFVEIPESTGTVPPGSELKFFRWSAE